MELVIVLIGLLLLDLAAWLRGVDTASDFFHAEQEERPWWAECDLPEQEQVVTAGCS